MSEPIKKSLISVFRLPKIPIKGLFTKEKKGLISYPVTNHDLSWEVKDPTGVQIFWVENKMNLNSKTVGELVGIFGEQIATLDKDNSSNDGYNLLFTASPDAPEYSNINIKFEGGLTASIKKLRVQLVSSGSKKLTRDYVWENTSPTTWSLSLKGESKVQGTFIRLSKDQATLNFPTDLLPEEIAVFGFLMVFVGSIISH